MLPSGEAAPGRRLAAEGGDGDAPLVLVVEDDPYSRDLLWLYLTGAGFRVEVAGDGLEGLAAAARLRPAAIVLDIILPRLDGWEFLARVKADETLAEIPVVVVSMLDERGKGFALGAAGYLVKPVKRAGLLGALARITAAGGPGPSRVLAIDDDAMALDLIAAVLKPEGFEVLTAASGEAGIKLAHESLPALVVVDLLMPGMDGFAVVESLRAREETSRIPIIVLTSKTMTPEEKERLNGQIDHLARKGEFDRAGFIDLVRTFCAAGANRGR